MADWSHGYNVSTGYTFGFYRETAPDWLDMALATRGWVPPRIRGDAGFRYLELGCGQGLGLCLLAAANPSGEFVGIDFGPEHIAHARSLAGEMGLSNIRFDEGDFAELGTAWPTSYGQFDYVMLHGIYSWVPKAIRSALVAILKAATGPGGAVYLSYNAMPGWTSTQPFQHMLRLLETSGGVSGMQAIEAGRELFAALDQAGSGLTKALPALKARIENTRNQPSAYLVQEYLHENWHPLWCSQVMGELAGAKLSLAGSATIAENLLPAVLPKAMQEIAARQQAPMLREDVIDCLINQTFRRDLFVRGPRKLNTGQAAWREGMRVWRLKPEEVPAELSIKTGFGTVNLTDPAARAMLEALSPGSLTVAEIMALPEARQQPGRAQQSLLLLLQAGWLGCGWGEGRDGAGAVAANAAVARLAAEGAPYRHLAAPALGSGVPASDSELLMLDAFLSPSKGEAQGLAQRLQRLGRQIAKDGKPLTGEAETAEIRRLEEQFASRTLPEWKRLGVIA